MEDIKVGFIGLGIMGKPMAKNLLKAGYEVFAYDNKQIVIDELTDAGAKGCSDAKELGSSVDVVIVMVQDSANSESAIISERGVLHGLKKGSAVIDMSSISPLVSQKIYKECLANGVDFLDAPVSGGEPMAISGDLAIMVGGEEKVFNKFSAIFDIL